MMMMGDKKKLITTVVGKLSGPKPEHGGETGAESDSSIGKELAVKKLFSALESKDHKAGAAALDDFMAMGEPSESEMEPDPEYGE